MSSTRSWRAEVALAAGALAIVAAVVAGTWYVSRPGDPILRYDPQRITASTPASALSAVDSMKGTTDTEPVADPRWVAKNARKTGIPLVAMRAYANAALRLGGEQPECGIGWTTLAGIGYIESQHGTIDGRTLRPDGRSEPLILGPALNGVGDVAAIASTAQSVRWHGDPTWDHAVGPLQFIPSSWNVWAGDADGNGVADPNDIDDAALAAGRYLCADGQAMGGEGWGAAVMSYNHSNVYVQQVYDAAAAYASRSL